MPGHFELTSLSIGCHSKSAPGSLLRLQSSARNPMAKDSSWDPPTPQVRISCNVSTLMEDITELLEFDARAMEERLATAEERLASSEEKLASAEEEVRETLTKLITAEIQAKESIMAAQAEAMIRVSAADQRAQRAVEAYKGSAEFAAECSEAAVDAYAKGFEKCKEKILQVHHLGNLDDIQPDILGRPR